MTFQRIKYELFGNNQLGYSVGALDVNEVLRVRRIADDAKHAIIGYIYYEGEMRGGGQFCVCSQDAADLVMFQQIINKKGGNRMFADIKKYIAENRDVFYTIAFVAVLDQLFFDGALREKLKTMAEGLLNKAEGKTLVAGS